MAQALATPVAPSLSLICNPSRNPNSFSNRVSFPVLGPAKVSGDSASFNFFLVCQRNYDYVDAGKDGI